jgi:phosphoribosylformylglycinamidine (FGAM) synthase PurS component
MVNRIEVGFRKGVRDALGEKVRRRIIQNLHMDVEDVRTVDVYTIEGDLRKRELTAAARGPLSDPIIQRHAVNRGLADGFDWLIEVGFRPGVTDNVGKTARESIEIVLGDRRGGKSIRTPRERSHRAI